MGKGRRGNEELETEEKRDRAGQTFAGNLFIQMFARKL